MWCCEEPSSASLLVVGLNHRIAPLELRERLAIPLRALPEVLTTLRASAGVTEVAILSTCNRVELYATTSNLNETSERLVDFLCQHGRLSPQQLTASLYRCTGDEAVRHLFRVTSGLDSMVLGESEITAQVKHAYRLAHAAGTTGAVLNRLFQKALHAVKVLRSQTRIAEGQASIGSVVAALAHERFGDRLRQCEVLLWGAGKAAEATARHLIKGGVGQLWIVNRTQTKAQDLALLCQGGWLSWEQALKHLAHVDIAIVCTQAPHYVVDRADAETCLSQRAGRPLFLIDLAVPRNVDPAIARLPGICLYNIDDLQEIAQAALAQRQQELDCCEALIQEQVNHFCRWWNAKTRKEAIACQLVEA